MLKLLSGILCRSKQYIRYRKTTQGPRRENFYVGLIRLDGVHVHNVDHVFCNAPPQYDPSQSEHQVSESRFSPVALLSRPLHLQVENGSLLLGVKSLPPEKKYQVCTKSGNSRWMDKSAHYCSINLKIQDCPLAYPTAHMLFAMFFQKEVSLRLPRTKTKVAILN